MYAIPKPLLYSTSLLGISTSLHKNDTKWSKIKTMFFVAGQLALFTFGLYVSLDERIREDFPSTMKSSILVEIIAMFTRFALNVMITLQLNLMRTRQFRGIFEKIEMTDRRTKLCASNGRENFIFLIANIYFSLVLTMEIYIYLTHLQHIRYFFFDIFEKYRILLAILLLQHIINQIKRRFRFLNKSIGRLKCNVGFADLVKPKVLKHVAEAKYIINNASIAYTTLTDAVNEFNDLFGWFMLILYLHLIAVFLKSLNWCIIFTESELVKWDFTAWCLVWTSTSAAVVIWMTSIYESTMKEAQVTRVAAYAVLQNLDSQEVADLREDLVLLIRQATTRNPVFTAAGFFNMDYSMLFTLMEITTSYIIVLIQFSRPN